MSNKSPSAPMIEDDQASQTSSAMSVVTVKPNPKLAASAATAMDAEESENKDVRQTDILEVHANHSDMNFSIEGDLLTRRRTVASVTEDIPSTCDLDSLVRQCEHNVETVYKLVGDPHTCPLCECNSVLTKHGAMKEAHKRQVSDLKHDRDRFNQELLLQQKKVEALEATIRALNRKYELCKEKPSSKTLVDQTIRLEEENYKLAQKVKKMTAEHLVNESKMKKLKTELANTRSAMESVVNENHEFHSFMANINGQYADGMPLFHFFVNLMKQMEFNSALLQQLYKQQRPNDVVHYRVYDGDVIGRWMINHDGATPCDLQARTHLNPHDLKPYSLLQMRRPPESEITDAWASEPERFGKHVHQGLQAWNLKMVQGARALNAESNKTTPKGNRARKRTRAWAGVSVGGRQTYNWPDYDHNRALMSPYERPPPVSGRNPLYRPEAKEVEAEHQRVVVDRDDREGSCGRARSGSTHRSRNRNRSKTSRSKSTTKSRSSSKPSATVTSESLRKEGRK